MSDSPTNSDEVALGLQNLTPGDSPAATDSTDEEEGEGVRRRPSSHRRHHQERASVELGSFAQTQVEDPLHLHGALSAVSPLPRALAHIPGVRDRPRALRHVGSRGRH
jgi:hypothetical protein